MSPRTIAELSDAVTHAKTVNDLAALEQCAIELAEYTSPDAMAVRSIALGWIASCHGDYPGALRHYQYSLALAHEIGDVRLTAGITNNIGSVYTYLSDYSQALDYHHRALQMYEQCGELRLSVSIVNNIGIVHQCTGNYPLALENFYRALELHERYNDTGGIANVTCNIGGVHSVTGNYPEALEHFHRALNLHQALGNRRFQAIDLGNMGVVYVNIGNYSQALVHYERALAIHCELNNRSGESSELDNLGEVYFKTGDYTKALLFHQHALALAEELGELRSIARSTVGIIDALIASEAYDKAETLLASFDPTTIDDPEVAIMRECSRARLQEHSGAFQEALTTLENALRIAIERSLPADQARIHLRLRDLAQTLNDFAGYVHHNGRFTSITEEINGKETATKLAMQEKQREIDAKDREHQKLLAVLHSTLPMHIADRVSRGETVNDHYEDATVVFVDIVGFTTLSDSLTSSQVVALLDTIFSSLDAICKKHDVIKIKTIGDSYLAVAFPLESSSSEQRAASAALDILDAISRIVPPTSSPLQVRIGMHSGPITAGVIGTERLQYDVWGDTVNVASRMESTSQAGQIHVSEAFANALITSPPATLSSVRGGTSSPFPIPYSLRERGAIEIKGKGTMKTFWLE